MLARESNTRTDLAAFTNEFFFFFTYDDINEFAVSVI